MFGKGEYGVEIKMGWFFGVIVEISELKSEISMINQKITCLDEQNQGASCYC